MIEDEVTTAPAPETKETVVADKKVAKGPKGKVSKAADKKAPVAKIKKAKPAASNHPKYSLMIESAIKALKERNGSSRQAILKYITVNYGLESKKAATQLRLSLKRAVAAGSLKMAKESGKGAGCYKLSGPEENKKTKPNKENFGFGKQADLSSQNSPHSKNENSCSETSSSSASFISRERRSPM